MKNYELIASTNGNKVFNPASLPLEDDNEPKARDVAFREIQAVQSNKWLTAPEKEMQIRKIREQFREELI